MTVVYADAIGPIDVPINARFFNQDPEKWNGTVVRRQSFRISAFSKEDQKQIDKYRMSSRAIMNKLALPLEKGLYWIPIEMIPICKEEIAVAELKAKDKLNGLVLPHPGSFVEAKRMEIEQDLEQTHQDIIGKGDLPRDKLAEVLNLLERKIQTALESNIVTPVGFLDVSLDLQRSEEDHEAPWIQIEKLIFSLVRFPTRIKSKPNLLQDLATDPELVLKAMDVETDAFLQFAKLSEEQVIDRAKLELGLLDRIADSDIGGRDRCEVYLMIIDGKADTEIHTFVNRNQAE